MVPLDNPLLEAEEQVKYLPYTKMEDPRVYEVIATCFGLGMFMLTGLLLAYCYVKYKVSQKAMLMLSTASLISGAKAHSLPHHSMWRVMCERLSWHEMVSLVLVGVMMVITVGVIVWVCLTYPPSCCLRRRKSLWIAGPLVLLMLTAPAQGYGNYYEIDEGQDIMFNVSGPFLSVNWTKLIGTHKHIDVAFANHTFVELFDTKNWTDAGWVAIYGNGSMKLKNCSSATGGVYTSIVERNSTSWANYTYFDYSYYTLAVIPPIPEPIISIEHLKGSHPCSLVCSCSGVNVTFVAHSENSSQILTQDSVVNLTEVERLTCTAQRKLQLKITEVSVREVCKKLEPPPETDLSDLWWMLLALLVMIAMAILWFKLRDFQFRVRRGDLVPLLLVFFLVDGGAALNPMAASELPSYITSNRYLHTQPGKEVLLTLKCSQQIRGVVEWYVYDDSQRECHYQKLLTVDENSSSLESKKIWALCSRFQTLPPNQLRLINLTTGAKMLVGNYEREQEQVFEVFHLVQVTPQSPPPSKPSYCWVYFIVVGYLWLKHKKSAAVLTGFLLLQLITNQAQACELRGNTYVSREVIDTFEGDNVILNLKCSNQYQINVKWGAFLESTNKWFEKFHDFVEVTQSGSRLTSEIIFDFCTNWTSVNPYSLILFNISLDLPKITAKYDQEDNTMALENFEFNFKDSVRETKSAEAISEAQHEPQKSNYWKDYWWVYLLACIGLFLLVLFCVICAHNAKLKSHKSWWFVGPFVLLMIVDGGWACQSTREITLPHFGGTFNLQITCQSTVTHAIWSVEIGDSIKEFLEYVNHTYWISPEDLVFCAGYNYNENSFNCEVKQMITSITVKSEGDQGEKQEIVNFKYRDSINHYRLQDSESQPTTGNPWWVYLLMAGGLIILGVVIGLLITLNQRRKLQRLAMLSPLLVAACIPPAEGTFPYAMNENITITENSHIFFNISEEKVMWAKYIKTRRIDLEYSVFASVSETSVSKRETVISALHLKAVDLYSNGSVDIQFGVGSSGIYLQRVERTSEVLQFFYNITVEKLPPTTRPPTLAPQISENHSRQSYWWVAVIFVMILIAFMIGLIALQRHKLKTLALISPVLLAVCIPPTEATNFRINQNVTAQEGSTVFLNVSLNSGASIIWAKYISKNFGSISSQYGIRLNNATLNYLKLSAELLPNGSLSLTLMSEQSQGIYVRIITESDGSEYTFHYNITVKKVAFQPQKQLEPTSAPQLPSNAQKYWWAIALAVLTVVVFVGVLIKVKCDPELGLPPSYYTSTNTGKIKKMLLLACVCCMIKSIDGKICEVKSNHQYFVVNHTGLINAYVKYGDVYRTEWKKMLTEKTTQTIVERYRDKDPHFFRPNFEIASNGSLLIDNVTLQDSGTYLLSCLLNNGSIEDGSTVVTVKEACTTPNFSVSTELYGENLCLAKASCNATNSNPVILQNQLTKEYYAGQRLTAKYWIYMNSTLKTLLTCSCNDSIESKTLSVVLDDMCQSIKQEKYMYTKQVSYHHLWWIFALMIIIAAAIVAACWRWYNHIDALHDKNDPEKLPTLTDPNEIS